MAEWTVRADYDPEARVWYVLDSDMPGLHCDAETLDGLQRKIGPMIEDLLEINADDLTQAQAAPPHLVRVIAHHERSFDIAA
jgi:Domain of unknown function (DUF1902)